MKLADFLEKVVRGDVGAVAAALDASPELLEARGEHERLWRGSANALAVAAASGQAAIVRLLLARGAHLKAAPTDVSPIPLAAIEGRTEIVRILLATGLAVDILAASALGDRQQVTTFLQANPALVRECTHDWKRPLHFCRDVGVARLLLAAGAELDALDDEGPVSSSFAISRCPPAAAWRSRSSPCVYLGRPAARALGTRSAGAKGFKTEI
jgi:ankyrin repeat protein